MKLTRELIGRIPAVKDDPGPLPNYFTDEQRAESLAATLAHPRARRPVWVFAYGSLIWKPEIPFAEKRIATVRGYHRQFCLRVKRFRGSPEEPGLVLGLEPGGVCRGVAYRLAEAECDGALKKLWARELLTGAYVPRWVDAHTEGGVERAIAFTINRTHERYTGRLTDPEAADALARACGHVGSSAEYLMETVAHLEELGIRDERLWRLQQMVAERIAARFPSP
ncbi:MAG TPA: gamma-glutamylcyclotransferase [Dongiaceae bacterium]|jgi:cation transport protein ChaC